MGVRLMSALVERLIGSRDGIALVLQYATEDRATLKSARDAMADAANAIQELLAVLKEAAEFIQPFNRAEDLYARIETVIAKAEVQA